MNRSRCFAVIPAAGRSRRMGHHHKLLLRWGETSIINQVLDAWINSRIDRVVLVSRPDDRALHDLLGDRADVELVIPGEAPADMKRSVQFGLEYLSRFNPDDSDRWLIAPADMPTLSSPLINRVMEESQQTPSIVAPRFAKRRGHPVSFPWTLVSQIAQLGDDEGINRLLDRHPVRWIDLDANEFPEDIDTDEDYQRLTRRRDPRDSD